MSLAANESLKDQVAIR